jgi:hypothetical protein
MINLVTIQQKYINTNVYLIDTNMYQMVIRWEQ